MDSIPVVQDHTPAPIRDGKFHVRLTEGRFQTLRRYTSWPLIALFFGLVWVQVNGQPWLLFSLAGRKLILFGQALSWHDLPLLAGLLITAACLLFFLAVAWGRIWCGFACPQSIWTWLFIRIEQWTEGRASVRARQQTQPMTLARLSARIAKHLLWLLLSLLTALTFTGYFIPIRELIGSALQFELASAVTGWLVIMSALTYANAGLVREKICLHACPYSRFQAVMFDRNTRTVSYDARRGEPRAHKRNAGSDSGDCVDCGLCVQVCPTGIDIRDGLQAACIDCGACIDACAPVMAALKRPDGLIRFASEAQLTGQTSPLLRPRLAAYGTVVLLACGALIYGFSNTKALLVEVQRDRNTLFTQLDDQQVCNNYRVKVEGFEGREFEGQEFDATNTRIAVSVSGDADYVLFGPAEIDLTEHNAHWLPYRVCSTAPAPARVRIRFHFNGLAHNANKETTFLRQVR